MYNVRKSSESTKNIKVNDANRLKCKSNCTCPNALQFKNDQSKLDERHNNNSWIKITEETRNFLSQLRKYPLDNTKTRNSPETKKYISPRHSAKIDAYLKSFPDVIVRRSSVNETCKNRPTSKTEPNLCKESYVEDLKREIKSKKREIPYLPEKYRKKYVKSLKEELLLNKLASCHDKSQQVEENDAYQDHNKLSTGDNVCIGIEVQNTVSGQERRRKHSPEGYSTKNRRKKDRKGRSGERKRFDRIARSKKHHVPICDKPNRNQSKQRSDSLMPLSSKEELLSTIHPTKNFVSISTQYDVELIENENDNMNVAKKLDVIHNLIPQISSAIEKTEKNLEMAFQNALAPAKIVTERGVSPIKDIVELSCTEESTNKVQNAPDSKAPPNTPQIDPNISHDISGDSKHKQTNPKNPYVGDLLLNIQNIKDSRCLLNGFQNELVVLKDDIQNCQSCKEGKNLNTVENFCEKHVVYIPLLKVGEIGSKSDQINLFNVLKTEVNLKKDLENLIQHISKLERKLSKAKKEHDLTKAETIANELKLARSYYENLLIKQQNERLINEQQKTMKVQKEHDCENDQDCEKCCLQRQIYDLLLQVRTAINKDIEESKQRLKVQKMPPINIRKPLQIQNILNLDIPPSSIPPVSARSNLAYEAVVKNAGSGHDEPDEATQTRILINKTTSVEISHPDKTMKMKHTVDKEKRDIETETPKETFIAKAPYESDFNKKVPRQLEQPSSSSVASKTRKQKKVEKTPSELGFRHNIETQCDSNASLIGMSSNETQTFPSDDSNFLFGFKEYLMKNPRESSSNPLPNLADVSLQISLNDSDDSVIEYKSVGVNTESVSRRTSAEEKEGLTVMSSHKPKAVDRIPSLKKMFLMPSDLIEKEVPEFDISMKYPHTEPKYRARPFSHNKIDIPEQKTTDDDNFYKNLTEDLSERRTYVPEENQPHEDQKLMQVEQEVNLLRDTASSDMDESQNADSIAQNQNTIESDNESAKLQETNSDNLIQFEDLIKTLDRTDSVENIYMPDTGSFTEIKDSSENSPANHSFDMVEPNAETNIEQPGDDEIKPENNPKNVDGNVSFSKETGGGSNGTDETILDASPAVDRRVTIEKQFIQKDDTEDLSKTTILPLFSPNIKILLNRNHMKTKSDDDNLLLSADMLENLTVIRKTKPSTDFSQNSRILKKLDEKHPENSIKLITEKRNSEKFLITSPSQTKKIVPSITNYILHRPPESGVPCKSLSNNTSKVTKERSDYFKKCSKVEKHVDCSSVASSEGEVSCKCKNISRGEIHTCPQERFNPTGRQTGIHYKEKLSSHMDLEKERKHYQHWVTYYSTKKTKNESCPSSVTSDTVHDS